VRRQQLLRSTTATLLLACSLLLAAAGPAAAGTAGGCRPLADPSTHVPLLVCRAGARGANTRTGHRSRPLPGAQARDLAGAAIAKVLATPCLYTELTPGPADLDLVQSAVLCLVNKKRAENGEAPLLVNGDLERAAEAHSREMVAADYFEHMSPSGETPFDRIRSAGYIPNSTVGYVVGENLAWGTLELSTPQAIVEAWFASPEHLANILEGHYRETGIGVVPSVPESLAEGQPGAIYTEDFGTILR